MASENKVIQPVLTSTILQNPAPLQQEDGEREIDLMELLSVMLSKAAWIIASVLLCAVAAFILTSNFTTPLYKSTMISIDNPTNTRILEITVQSADPVETSMIANELVPVVNDYITNVMKAVKPNVLSTALTPPLPSSPSKTRNTLIGAVLGGFLCALVIFIMFMVDDKIKSPEDILKYTGLPTLAIVPRSKDETQTGRGGESTTTFSRKQLKKLAKKKPLGETLPVK